MRASAATRLAAASCCLVLLPTLPVRAAETPGHEGSSNGASADSSLVRCIPAAQRHGRELGCFIVDTAVLGPLPDAPLYWYLDTYPTKPAAQNASDKHSRIVEAYGKVWLLTIADGDWKSNGGTHIARIGPLPLPRATSYSVVYMEATFLPGMHSIAHRHSGPEAWYVVAGEQCLETPGRRMRVHTGGSGIVPAGPPMMLFGTGSSKRQSLVLVLHDSSKAMSSLAPDWKPAGLCTQSK